VGCAPFPRDRDGQVLRGAQDRRNMTNITWPAIP
jgi:hypothetical protein